MADVSNETGLQAMFAQAVTEFGTLEILVSNAGLQRDAFLHETTMAQINADDPSDNVP
jgi:glucose 1-dehydrogenase